MVVERCLAISIWRWSAVRRIMREVFRPRAIAIVAARWWGDGLGRASALFLLLDCPPLAPHRGQGVGNLLPLSLDDIHEFLGRPCVHVRPLMRVDSLEVVNGVLDLFGLGGQISRLARQFLDFGFGLLNGLVIAWFGLLQVGDVLR